MSPIASFTAGLISFKMSLQFSLKKLFAVSPSCLLPLKRFVKWMYPLRARRKKTKSVKIKIDKQDVRNVFSKSRSARQRNFESSTHLAVSKSCFDFTTCK